MSCQDCKTLRKEVNEKFSALLAFTNGRGPSGLAIAKCRCGLFVTTAITASHPVGGTELFYLCDFCEPPRHSFDSKTEYKATDMNSDAAWARSINKLVKEII
jgi:hypothetical protein